MAVAAPRVAAPLALDHDEVLRRLGGHRFDARSRIRSLDGETTEEDLAEEIHLQVDAGGQYRLVHDNGQGLGKEVVFVGGVLHTRHRYGAFLARPDGAGEAARLRAEAWATLGAYLDTCAHGIEVIDEGSGRLRIALSAAPRRARSQPFPEKQWRESVTVEVAEGRATIEDGVPTVVALRLAYAFQKAGRRPRVEIDYTHRVTRGVPSIHAPEALPTPVRRSLEDERKRLLGGP